MRFVAEAPDRTRVELEHGTSIAMATAGSPSAMGSMRRRMAALLRRFADVLAR